MSVEGPGTGAQGMGQRAEGPDIATTYKYEYERAPYATLVTATFHPDRWAAVFFSWLSLKGFLMGVRSVENTRLYVTEEEGFIHATFVIVFSNGEAVGAWLEEGYTVEEMLRAEGVPNENIHTLLVRDFS